MREKNRLNEKHIFSFSQFDIITFVGKTFTITQMPYKLQYFYIDWCAIFCIRCLLSRPVVYFLAL